MSERTGWDPAHHFLAFRGFGPSSADGRGIVGGKASLLLDARALGAAPRISLEFSVTGVQAGAEAELQVYVDFERQHVLPLPSGGGTCVAEIVPSVARETHRMINVTLVIPDDSRTDGLRVTLCGLRFRDLDVRSAGSILGRRRTLPVEWEVLNARLADAPAALPGASFDPALFATVLEKAADGAELEHLVQIHRQTSVPRPWTLTFLFRPMGADGIRCALFDLSDRNQRVIVDFNVIPRQDAVVHLPQGEDVRVIDAAVQGLAGGWFRCHLAAQLPRLTVSASMSVRRGHRVVYAGHPDYGMTVGAVEFEPRLPTADSYIRTQSKPAARVGRDEKERGYFLICSQGNSGSIWLARALDLHPQITCSMGNDHPVISMNDSQPFVALPEDAFQSVRAGWSERICSPDDVALGIKRDEWRARDLVQGILDDKGIDTVLPERVPPLSHDSMFAELERFYDSTVYGNVHGLTLHNLATMKGETSVRRPIVANLIRHPVARFQALIGRTVDVMAPRINLGPDVEMTMHDHQELVDFLSERYDVIWADARNRFMLWALMGLDALKGWADELTDFPLSLHIPIEKMMEDRAYFAASVALLTGGRVRADDAYLDAVFAPPQQTVARMHPQVRNAKGKSAEETFALWPSWLQDAFRLEAARLDLAGVHAPFGYDFSFLH